MNVIPILLLFLYQPHTVPIVRVPLTREGASVVEATCHIVKAGDHQPTMYEVQWGEKEGADSFVALPCERLAEMETMWISRPDATFRISGEVFAYGDQNYLLVRRAVVVAEQVVREHPNTVPVDPNVEDDAAKGEGDSIEDIVRDLESATGPLVQSIRGATEQPQRGADRSPAGGGHASVVPHPREGTRITARRCHLTRSNGGAWIAVFVSDATGLSDPPCVILPSVQFDRLTRWASGRDIATPVLLSGEIVTYHGRTFLVLRSWRSAHRTDYLDG